MKSRFHSLILSLLALMVSAASFAQFRTGLPVDLGIVNVYDETTHLNYNQLFKLVLKENAPTIGKSNLSVDLVEHPSQAALAVSLKLLDTTVVASYYRDGKPCSKDTFRVPKIEIKREVNAFSKYIEAGPEGITVANLPESSPEYKQGIRNGDIIKEVNGKSIRANDLEKAKQRLDGKDGKTIAVKIQSNLSWKSVDFQLKRVPVKTAEWQRPFSPGNLEEIFTAVLRSMMKQSSNMGIAFKTAPGFKMKSISKINSDAGGGKCRSNEQMALCKSSKMHPVANGFNTKDLFAREEFYVLKKDKKAQPGDAALNVLRFYNFDQQKSFLSVNDNVSFDVKNAVQKLSGPFYNKPGVLMNYFVAGSQYEKTGNYSAALNQFYSALLKVDDIIASDLAKARAKKVLFSHIANCSQQMNQTGYASLTTLAQQCMAELANDASLRDQDRNFYEFSSQMLEMSREIESKLATQRNEKKMAILGAVLSAAAGVATFDLDIDLSVSLFVNSIDILDDNANLNFQINSAISQATHEVKINLPAELQDEENNPYELVLTSAITYAFERAKHKEAILSLIGRYADGNPALANVASELMRKCSRDNSNLDHTQLVAQLCQQEKTVYRYEKRGLSVPGNEIARP
ncbi:MAG: PDZ domain-containing protein [Lewinellaceae bacterium]|nr:PDZ domain-containing protein [Saprospiraceae bacterium]MCB9340947.1 PDZ domain-containing protein [Lewinellaceae bacterium]